MTHLPEVRGCLAHRSGLEDLWGQGDPEGGKSQRKGRVQVTLRDKVRGDIGTCPRAWVPPATQATRGHASPSAGGAAALPRA